MSGIHIPKEIICQILEELTDARPPDTRYTWPLDELPEIYTSARRELAHARLINKAFCDCATPLLFQDFSACFPRASPGLTASAWAKKILDFSTSGLVGHVKRLKIGFEAWVNCSETPFLEDLLLEALYVIPTLVSACIELLILDIRGSPLDRERNPLLSSPQRRIYHQSVDQVLRLLSQVNGCVAPKSVSLSLPLAHDYGERLWKSSEYFSDTNSKPLARFLNSIHQLDVAISDSGGLGDRYSRRRTESQRHANHPNGRHQTEFWEFIGLAKQLRSLTIRCPEVLNFDQFSVSALELLRELKLTGVSMSESQLSRLVNQNCSTLRAVELDHVKLDSGTWESGLLLFCALPQLEHFYVDSCGYTTTGASSIHAERLLPPLDDPQNIETLNYNDINALGHVQRHVNAVRNAANMPLYTEFDYRYLSALTLDEVHKFRTESA